MLINRKVASVILKRALKKCSRMYENGVHAYCTPVEYFILSDYFGYYDIGELKYYNSKIKKGISGNNTCYFLVIKSIDLSCFPIQKYAMLNTKMCGG